MPKAHRAAKKQPTRTEKRASRESRRTRLLLIGATVLSAVILAAWFPASALYHQRASLAGTNGQLLQLRSEDAALNQERELEGLVTALTGMLGPLLIVLMGLFVMGIVFAMLLPIFEMNSLIR